MDPDNIFNPETVADSSPEPRTTIDWIILFQWILATTVGWILGLVLGGELGIGVFVGITQWLVLRRFFSGAGWWVLATGAGWMGGWFIVVSSLILPPQSGLATSALSGGVLGLAMGLGQWLVLRRWVKLAGIWLLLSISGWAIGLTGLLGSTLVGAVAGVITGFAFDFLLRFPRSPITLKH